MSINRLRTTIVTVLLAGVAAPAFGDDDVDVVGSEAFDARGEQVTGQVCASACHGWDLVFGGPRQQPGQWDFIVSDMLGRGAAATQEQLAVIKPWLSWTWGEVWVNSAAAPDLVAVLGIPKQSAEAVVGYREEHGKFADLDALKAVPGIDAATIDARSDAIVFN